MIIGVYHGDDDCNDDDRDDHDDEIMIGGGGGCCGVTIEMVIFFGCRRQSELSWGDKVSLVVIVFVLGEDCLYREEMESMMDCGVFNSLHFAFSRETSKKTYVQHKIRENRREIVQMMKVTGFPSIHARSH
eukprot:747285-Hanusia_phi.AAC.5